MTDPSRQQLICLIGYRGTGKTSTARLLATRLGWQWRDADVELEAFSGKSIRRIFAEEGETAFRDLEEQLLRRLCEASHCVLATGGGVVLREANREQLRRAGLVVWLKADPGTLWDRLRQDASTEERRPALTRGGLAEIEELTRVREPLYRACAHLAIDTSERSPEEVAATIQQYWHGHA